MIMLYFWPKTFLFNLRFSYMLHTSKFWRSTLRFYNTINDYNFNYFRSNPLYEATTSKKMESKELENNISEIQSYCDNGSQNILKYLSKEKNVMTLKDNDISNCMFILAHMFHTKQVKHPIDFKWLDEKCTSLLTKWPDDTILSVFDAWFLILGSKSFKSQYFKKAMVFWQQNSHLCKKNHVVQILYYLGLSKNRYAKVTMVTFLPNVEAYIKEISPIEWAIICLSFFRESVKFSSEVLLLKTIEVTKYLIDCNSRFHLFSTIKCLRLSGCYDESLMRDLKLFICSQHKNFNFVECTNFMAIFSSANAFDKEVFTHLEDRAFQQLNEEVHHKNHDFSDHSHPSYFSRPKDVARFLWAMANVGYIPVSGTIDIIIKAIQLKYAKKHFVKQPHILVDCLQSLSILNIYPLELYNSVFSTNSISEILMMDRVKPKYQLYFLYAATQIECSKWHEEITNNKILQNLKPLPKDLKQQVDERTHLKLLFQLLMNLKDPYVSVQCCYVLPHIPLAGIYLSSHLNTKQVCIEVLDSYVCCRDSTEPIGFMKVKLRHLKTLLYVTRIVTTEEIDEIVNLPQDQQKDKASCLLKILA